MPIEKNPYFIAAYTDYMQARQMVRQGLLGNAAMQRNRLLWVYRILCGKVV